VSRGLFCFGFFEKFEMALKMKHPRLKLRQHTRKATHFIDRLYKARDVVSPLWRINVQVLHGPAQHRVS
jgi:hypothetical protein